MDFLFGWLQKPKLLMTGLDLVVMYSEIALCAVILIFLASLILYFFERREKIRKKKKTKESQS